MSHPPAGPPGPPPPPYGPPPYGPPPYGPPPYGPPPYGWPGPPPGAPPPPPPRRELPPYPHAQPEPYHRILRTWTYHWWRVLVGVLGTVLAMVVGPFVFLAIVGLGVEVLGLGTAGDVVEGLQPGGNTTPAALLVLNLSLAALIPITWLAVRVLHNLRPRWLGSVRPGLRWRLLGKCLGLAVAATLLSVVVASLLIPEDLPTAVSSGKSAQTAGTTAAYLLIIGLTTPLQSAGEEYLFRGYLLQGFGAVVRARWFTLLCTSLLFAFAHGSQTLAAFVDRFAFGLVAGGLVLFTGGLEAAIALHVINNLVVLSLAAATGTISEALGATNTSWSPVIFDLVLFVVYALLVAWMFRRGGATALTAGPPTADAHPAGSAAGPAASGTA